MVVWDVLGFKVSGKYRWLLVVAVLFVPLAMATTIYAATKLPKLVNTAIVALEPAEQYPPGTIRDGKITFSRDMTSKIPYEVKKFQEAGLKADEYEIDEKYPTQFASVVVRMPRTCLRDDITGKSEWFTRVRLTQNTYHSFGWKTVEYLP